MKTITLKIDESISEKLLWFLNLFSKNELTILEQSDYITDDEYLRSIDGMVQSIKEARAESLDKGVSLSELEKPQLLEIIQDNPYRYPPEYEFLKGDMSGLISRRINKQHRLVYEVIENEKLIKIYRMWTHYE